jgi:class 3 adenylate cyclase
MLCTDPQPRGLMLLRWSDCDGGGNVRQAGLGRVIHAKRRAVTPPRIERRLAAILAADVAGYSRLMGADEVGTLTALKVHRRERIDPAIDQHNGRIVKTTGDGTLVEFASVVDAVICAVAIQRAMLASNAAIPENRQIELRIGINVGDIIIDGGDIIAFADLGEQTIKNDKGKMAPRGFGSSPHARGTRLH